MVERLARRTAALLLVAPVACGTTVEHRSASGSSGDSGGAGGAGSSGSVTTTVALLPTIGRHDEFGGYFFTIGLPLLVTGTSLLGVGLPLIALGAREPPGPPPALRLGPGSAWLEGSF
jgi:hypothetical protein